MIGVLSGEHHVETWKEKHKEKGRVMTDTKIETLWLQPPEVGRGKKDSPLEPCRGMWPCRHSDFRHVAYRTEREEISVVSYAVCSTLLE